MEASSPEPRPDRLPADAAHPAQSLRISDEDRHRVAEVLRTAAGEGRLDLEELDERLEAAYRAKTYADLVPITVDLPGAVGVQPGVARPPVTRHDGRVATGSRHSASLALMSETKRVGPWLVGDVHTALAVMGSVVLDLREAVFETGQVTINANAVMGEVKVLVDAGTLVDVSGLGVMGEYTEHDGDVTFDPSAGGAVVRVRGFSLMGSVTVHRRARPGR
jgi:hypothetical protein